MLDLSVDHFSAPTSGAKAPAASVKRQPAGAVLARRQQALLDMGRHVEASPELPVVAQDAAQLMADMLETDYGAVAQWSAGEDPITLRVVKRIGDGQGSVQSVQIPAGGDSSLVGYTLNGRQPVLVESLGREQRFRDPVLQRLNIRSALSVPLGLEASTFGILAACSLSVRTFEPEDVSFAESLGHVLTTTIVRKQTEDAFAAQRRAASVVLDTIDALVLVLDPQGRIQDINRAAQANTGFTGEGLRGRPIWSVFCTPEEAPSLEAALRRLEQEPGPVGCEIGLVTKYAQKRRVVWNCGAVRDGRGRLESIIATGIDVTDRTAGQARAESEPTGLLRTPSRGGKDRRTQPRKSYPYQQMIAPLVGPALPDQNSFTPVTCHDISPGGFSFVASAPPASNEYVVALGREGALTYVIAEVAHMTRVEQEGKRMYLIGCNYVGRTEY